MKARKAVLLILLLLLYAFDLFAQGNSKKPNVLIIYTDDQGTLDMNIYGAKDLYTPNMDRLAQSGVRFTQFYSAAPICSPSRASLLTGRYPQRAGLPNMASSKEGMVLLTAAPASAQQQHVATKFVYKAPSDSVDPAALSAGAQNVVMHPGFLYLPSDKSSLLPEARVKGGYYYDHCYGFFCKMEWETQERLHIPVSFRLGTLSYVNRLEGKDK